MPRYLISYLLAMSLHVACTCSGLPTVMGRQLRRWTRPCPASRGIPPLLLSRGPGCLGPYSGIFQKGLARWVSLGQGARPTTPNAPLIEMRLPGELLLESTSEGLRWCVRDLLGSTSSENIRRSLPMCSKYRFCHPETPDFTAAPSLGSLTSGIDPGTIFAWLFRRLNRTNCRQNEPKIGR